MRTLLLFVTFLGLCQADAIFNISASANGENCSDSTSTGAICSVPEDPHYGPNASSGVGLVAIPSLNGGPNSQNEIIVGGQLIARGNDAPGETTSGLAFAQLSGSFTIPESWTNVYLIGGYDNGPSSPSSFYVTAGDQKIYLPLSGLLFFYYNSGFPVPPAVIYHTPGTPESITFDRSVSADRYGQINDFVFGVTAINAASVPEPTSLGFLAAALALIAIGSGIRKLRT